MVDHYTKIQDQPEQSVEMFLLKRNVIKLNKALKFSFIHYWQYKEGINVISLFSVCQSAHQTPMAGKYLFGLLTFSRG